MIEIGGDVDRHAMIGHPAPYPHPDRRELGLAGPGPVCDPDADAAFAALALNAKLRQGEDAPFFELVDVAAHIAAAPGQVEHHIDDPLAGPMIGVAAAAAGAVDR